MQEKPPFTALAAVYDAIMEEVEYQDWIDFILELLTQEDCFPQTVLDLACGTGNSTAPFVTRGLEVYGVDASSEMLEIARKKLPQVPFLEGTFSHFALPPQFPQRFDLVTCLFDSLNNLLSSQDVQVALERIYSHLEPGGWLAADLNTRLGVRELWEGDALEGVAQTSDQQEVHYHWSHHYDPATELGTVQACCRIGEREFLELHTERGYDPAELERLCVAAGFARVLLYEYPDFATPNEDSPRVWVFAQK
jgi:ubiquinone/menaquinone biosynthesis C-methylase UbiE